MKKIFVALLMVSLVMAAAVVSIDKVELRSDFDDISGEVWSVFLVVSEGITDKLIFTVDEGELEADGQTNENLFTIEMTGLENSCVYDVDKDTDTHKDVFTITSSERICNWWEDDPANCANSHIATECNVLDPASPTNWVGAISTTCEVLDGIV